MILESSDNVDGDAAETQAESRPKRMPDQSIQYVADMLAAIGTWTAIGYLLDRWWGTAPVFVVIGAIVGNTAGLYLLYLRSNGVRGNWPTSLNEPTSLNGVTSSDEDE